MFIKRKLKCSFLVKAYSPLFNNVFEALNLLFIKKMLCSRNSATWRFPSHLVKYKSFMPAASVDRSLQLSISAETVHNANHLKLPAHYQT
jgi:hypothetical protein